MKRRNALAGLGLVAAVALVSTAIAGGGAPTGVTGGGDDGASAAAKKKKKKAKPGPQAPAGPAGRPGSPRRPPVPPALVGNTVVETQNSVAVSTWRRRPGASPPPCDRGLRSRSEAALDWTAGTSGGSNGPVIVESFPTSGGDPRSPRTARPTEWTASGINNVGSGQQHAPGCRGLSSALEARSKPTWSGGRATPAAAPLV